MDLSRFSQQIIKTLEISDCLMIFHLDCSQRILSVNAAAGNLLNQAKPLEGICFNQLLPESSQTDFQNALNNGIKQLKLVLNDNSTVTNQLELYIHRLSEGWLLIGEPLNSKISSSEALNEISLLNNQLTNITRELQRKNRQLKEAAENIKKLRGMLPICSYCKKIRDDKGYWDEVETFITQHSGACFSHGICPECLEKHFPDFADEIVENNDKNKS